MWFAEDLHHRWCKLGQRENFQSKRWKMALINVLLSTPFRGSAVDAEQALNRYSRCSTFLSLPGVVRAQSEIGDSTAARYASAAGRSALHFSGTFGPGFLWVVKEDHDKKEVARNVICSCLDRRSESVDAHPGCAREEGEAAEF
jgi:hypothetical protein